MDSTGQYGVPDHALTLDFRFAEFFRDLECDQILRITDRLQLQRTITQQFLRRCLIGLANQRIQHNKLHLPNAH
jgi:hypothetical protein